MKVAIDDISMNKHGCIRIQNKPHSTNSLLKDTEIWIPYNVHISFEFFQQVKKNVKDIPSSMTIQK